MVRLAEQLRNIVDRLRERRRDVPVPLKPARHHTEESDPGERFLAEVRKYQGHRIRRLDWLPGEYFTPDGGTKEVETDKMSATLMTGVLTTPSGERSAAFAPFEEWRLYDIDEHKNEYGCPGLENKMPEGVTCGIVTDSEGLTEAESKENDAVLRDIYHCWKDRRPFRLRIWRAQDRFSWAVTHNTLSGGFDRLQMGRGRENGNYRLKLVLGAMHLNGYTVALQEPEAIRIGVCRSVQGFIETANQDTTDSVFLELVSGWGYLTIPIVTFCRFCGQVARQEQHDSFTCTGCGEIHKWDYQDWDVSCSRCQSRRPGGRYCVVCCACSEDGNANK